MLLIRSVTPAVWPIRRWRVARGSRSSSTIAARSGRPHGPQPLGDPRRGHGIAKALGPDSHEGCAHVHQIACVSGTLHTAHSDNRDLHAGGHRSNLAERHDSSEEHTPELQSLTHL